MRCRFRCVLLLNCSFLYGSRLSASTGNLQSVHSAFPDPAHKPVGFPYGFHSGTPDGWQRNNVIRLAVLDVIIFCTPFCKGFYLVPSQTVRLLSSTQYTVYRVVSQIATTKSNQKRDFFSENRSTTNRLFTRWQRHLDLPLFLLDSASRPNQN